MEQTATEYCFLCINWWATCMTKGEWSGWMQAIGSVLAICWAIWLFTSENRRRDEEQRLQAELIALSTVGILTNLISWCESLVASLIMAKKSSTEEIFGAALRRFSDLERPPIESIGPVILRIKNETGARLATAWTDIDHAVVVMKIAAANDITKIENPDGIVRELIEPLPVSLRVARREMARFLTSLGYTVNYDADPKEEAVHAALVASEIEAKKTQKVAKVPRK